MEYGYIKGKIRHFLLKNCASYSEAVKQGKELPPVSTMARQLNKRCNIGERRLQKFLYANTTEKELSISISDIIAFSTLADSNLCGFVEYLSGETADSGQMTNIERNTLRFISQINLALRRELNLRIFHPDKIEEGEKVLKLALEMSSLSTEDLQFVKRLVKTLKQEKNLAEKYDG